MSDPDFASFERLLVLHARLLDFCEQEAFRRREALAERPIWPDVTYPDPPDRA
jgi:hypothetical protein